MTWAVSLVIADNHLIFFRSLCGYVYMLTNILTLSVPMVVVAQVYGSQNQNLYLLRCYKKHFANNIVVVVVVVVVVIVVVVAAAATAYIVVIVVSSS